MRPKAQIVDLRFDLWGTQPHHITLGGQQSLWVTSTLNGTVTGLFRNGSKEDFPVDGAPHQLALGGDSIWFTMPTMDAVGRIDHAGDIHTYDLPSGSQPEGIVATEDAAWATLTGTAGLARIDVDGKVESVNPAVTGDDELVEPPPADIEFVTMDDRGSLWFTRHGRGDIVRMDADRTTESWAVDDCSTPSAIAVDNEAVWIVDDSEGGIWRIGRGEKLLQRVEPWPTNVASAVVPDGRGGCWFTEPDEDLVGHIDADVTLTEYDISDYGTKPRDVVLDRDGIVWVTLFSGGIIGIDPRATGQESTQARVL